MESKWLGRLLDLESINELLKLKESYGISPVGEGGEFETLVIRSPLFKGKGIRIRKAYLEFYPHQWFGIYRIKDVAVY